MSREQRKAMTDRAHPQVSLSRQCDLLDISRASVYYRPVPTRAADLELMALMDRQYLKTPFYGSRRMKAWLRLQGHLVSRNRVRRLMRLMGLEAIYRRPNTSKPAPWAQSLPVPAEGSGGHSGQPSLGRGHHLHPHGSRVPLPGGHHGLVQPVCAGLEALQHYGCGLLCRGPGRSPGEGTAGGLQHRPG